MCPPGPLRRAVRDQPVDGPRANRSTRPWPSRQWQGLRDAYTGLGHAVQTIDAGARPAGHGVRGQRRHGDRRQGAGRPVPVPGAGRRRPGLPGTGSAQRGYRAVHEPRTVNEGEGDIVSAGPGDPGRARLPHRRSRAATSLTRCSGCRCISLRLVDPRFYHLDTALCVLDADTAAYYPAAFDDAGRAALAAQFAELIEAKDEDAGVLGPERGQRRPARGPARPGHRARRPAGRARASSRSRWTCRSSARPAAGPSAAHWSCGHDRGNSRARGEGP